MRAYRVLEALSGRYQVSLLTASGCEQAGNDTSVLALCQAVTVLPAGRPQLGVLARRLLRRLLPRVNVALFRQPSDWRSVSREDRAVLAAAFGDERFDLIHVFRLYMLPMLFGLPAHLTVVPAQLDLDDVESSTRASIARLARLNGDKRLADLLRRDADEYRRIECRDLARLRRVFVCSDEDRRRLTGGPQPPCVEVLPNVVTIREHDDRPEHPTSDPFVFLFVGSFHYYPNLDAAAFFCREVAPLIRLQARRPFEIRVVADGPERAWRRVPNIPEVRRARAPGGLAEEYARADAVVVPVRAGGGTRIKVLEAFACRRPVVSTSIGIEGLGVRAGEHALIGDTPAEFAAQCHRVMQNPALRRHLGERALDLVRRSYSTDALRRRLDEVEGLATEHGSKRCPRGVGARRGETPSTPARTR